MAEFEFLGTRWIEHLGPLTLQSGALVLFALALSLLARRQPAQLRHLLWLIVILRLALPTAISTPFGILGGEGIRPSAFTAASLESGLSESDPPAAAATPVRRAAPAAVDPAPTPTPARAASGPPAASPRMILAGLWLAGVLAFVGIVWVQLVSARRRLAIAAPAPDALASEVGELSRRVGVRPPRLLISGDDSALPSPALFGFARGTLVLPSEMALSWTAAEREPLIVHELAHLRRKDLWINWLQLGVQALYFFHPLVWLANRRLRIERELACDEEVTRFYGQDSNRYARALLRVARGMARRTSTAPALALASSRSRLGKRIRRLVAGTAARRPSRAMTAAVAAAAVAMVTLASARTAPLQEPSTAALLTESDLMRVAGEVLGDPERRAAVEAEWLEQVRTGEGDPVQLQRALALLRTRPSSTVGSVLSSVVGDREQRQAWEARLELLPNDPASLRGAAGFFMREDRDTAEDLLLSGWELQPGEMYWPLELARLEQLRGIGPDGGRARAARRALTFYQAAIPRLSDGDAYYVLGDAARAAVDAGDLESARRYANRLLQSASDLPRDWNYGNALHHGHTALGLVALAESDRTEATRQLQLSADTPGSPQLNSFGPSMRLASDLLATGERQAVLEYLDRCRAFWSSHMDDLNTWTAEIENGETPSFGNLRR